MYRVMNMDFYDITCDHPSHDREYIDSFFGRCQEYGIDTVFWRVSVCGKVAYRSAVRTMYDGGPHPRGGILADILRQFDPLTVACEAKRRHGIRLFPWVTLLDDYYRVDGNPIGLESRLVREHPEYCWSSRDGRKHYLGVLCYEYEAVVEERLAEIRELLEYDIDGLYLCTRGHAKFCAPVCEPDYFGFNEPWIREYKEKYGADIRTEPYDQERMNNIRGDSFTRFLKQARELTRNRGIPLVAGIRSEPDELWGISPLGHMRLQWELWMQERIVDRLVVFTGDDDGGMTEDDMAESEYRSRLQPFMTNARDHRIELLAWLRIWDWSRKYPHAPGDKVPTKPEEAIAKLLRRCARIGLDGVVMHEALNFETHGVWGALTTG